MAAPRAGSLAALAARRWCSSPCRSRLPGLQLLLASRRQRSSMSRPRATMSASSASRVPAGVPAHLPAGRRGGGDPLAVGYPVAYLLASLEGRRKIRLTLVFVVPLLMSYIIKIYAIRAILGRQGFLNRILLCLGLIDQPLEAPALQSHRRADHAVVLLLPFTILPIFVALERIPQQPRSKPRPISAAPPGQPSAAWSGRCRARAR